MELGRPSMDWSICTLLCMWVRAGVVFAFGWCAASCTYYRQVDCAAKSRASEAWYLSNWTQATQVLFGTSSRDGRIEKLEKMELRGEGSSIKGIIESSECAFLDEYNAFSYAPAIYAEFQTEENETVGTVKIVVAAEGLVFQLARLEDFGNGGRTVIPSGLLGQKLNVSRERSLHVMYQKMLNQLDEGRVRQRELR